ncbi:MAG: mechanosensitive ion channel family protein [Gemmatirosa sp.]|nr:mechanosensitive ion channel family protein [Gemmatirosa sp.]
MRFIDRVYYGNSLAAWLTAIGVLIGVWLLLVVVRRLLIRRLERFAARTTTAVDDVVLGALRRTSSLFLLVLAFAAAAHTAVELPSRVTLGVELLSKLVLLLQAASWGTGAIAFWLGHVTRHRGAHDQSSVTTLNVIAILARIVLWSLILLLALASFGIDITALVTGLGIAGIAVALAVQNVLGDLFASLSIALDKPFVIGDTINVDQFTGTVQDIGLKTTRLRSQSGELLVFPNADLLKSRIRNFRGQAERRVVFTITMPYDTPPETVEQVPKLVREIVEAQPALRFDRSHFSGFSSGGLAVETVYVMTTGDYNVYMDTQQRIYLALMRRLAALGVYLAAPTPTTEVIPKVETPPNA